MHTTGLSRPLRASSRRIPTDFQRRPWKFWDMHLPETAWDYTAHRLAPYRLSNRAMLLNGYMRESVPDSKLPEPWSCRWRAWGLAPYWHNFNSLWLDAPEQSLKNRLGIRVRKLLMFHSARLDNATTVFVGSDHTDSLAYYLYDAPTQDVYRFGDSQRQIVKPFVHCADWNNMTHLGSLFDFSPTPNQAYDRSGQPLYLHDLHTSETPWASGPRVHRAPFLERHILMVVAAREWCGIPDAHLPSPWSCDWSTWLGWSYGPDLIQDTLRRQYNIATPLNPIMFHPDSTTIFESHGIFYLFDPLRSWYSSNGRDHNLYRFPDSYASVEEFIENCDWNLMERMEWGASSGRLVSNVETQNLPLTHSEKGLRLTAAEPYGKRNLLAMTRPEATWSFQPRQDLLKGRSTVTCNAPHIAAWPSIPDTQLPAPFTCAWHAFMPADDWYSTGDDLTDTQEELRRCWGVPGLMPVMYMAHSPFDSAYHCPTVLRAGETYYLWLYQMDPIEPWLRKFEGSFKSVEDFMQNADWNRLSGPMKEMEDWFGRWLDENKNEE
ncbi:hypothetical protein FB451DRAFT_721910 [Mycena latifolia]|nr:hypothetical protein FB451DRAFT_721910 [Mycena latifolia]